MNRCSLTSVGVLPVLVFALGCGTSPKTEAILCTEFKIGADLTKADFGVGPAIKPAFNAYAQAAGDASGVASTILDEVASSCQRIAIDFGADPNDPRAADSIGTSMAKAWCDLAVEQYEAHKQAFDDLGLAVRFAAPHCYIDAAFDEACERTCRTNPACEEAPLTSRCAASDLSGICEGECTGSCEGSETAAATCHGACAGSCTGSCEKPLGGSVACVGVCRGACKGQCDAAEPDPGNGQHCNGTCTGRCEGRCEASGASTTVCDGTCTGGCAGSCVFADGAPKTCDATCRGGCTTAYRAPLCDGSLTPPTCPGDPDCESACQLSAAARASCTDGSLVVETDPAMPVDAGTKSLLHSLETNLPPVFNAARGRGKILVDNANDVQDAAGHLLGEAGPLSAKGVVCGLAVAGAASQASQNLSASLDGAKHLADAIDGNGGRIQ